MNATQVTVDVDRRTVMARRNGVTMHPAELTPKELDLLIVLAEANGRVVARTHLLKVIWGLDESGGIETRTVDQHLARLRKKLGSASKIIKTVTNYGYAIHAGIELKTQADIVGPVEKSEPFFKKGEPWIRLTVCVPHIQTAPKKGQSVRLATV